VLCLEDPGALASEFRAAGIEVRALGLPVSSLGAAVLAPPRVAGYLRAARPALLQVHMRRAGLVGRLAAWSVGVPCAVALHNLDPSPPAWLAPVERWLDTRSRFLAVSGAVAGHHRRRSREPIPVVPNALPAPRGGPRAKETAGRVGFLGKLEPKKGPDRFLALVEALRARGRPVEPVLAGPPHRPGYLSRELRRARVPWVGEVKDGTAFLAGLDLAIFPSRREGFGLAIGEALSVGTPVLLADLPPLREVYGELPAACFVPGAASPGRWAEAAARLLEDRGLRARVREAGRRILAGYPAGRASAAAEELYARWREELT
jgi:glycosyltransferase involved in cell wall biosynthesis